MSCADLCVVAASVHLCDLSVLFISAMKGMVNDSLPLGYGNKTFTVSQGWISSIHNAIFGMCIFLNWLQAFDCRCLQDKPQNHIGLNCFITIIFNLNDIIKCYRIWCLKSFRMFCCFCFLGVLHETLSSVPWKNDCDNALL